MKKRKKYVKKRIAKKRPVKKTIKAIVKSRGEILPHGYKTRKAIRKPLGISGIDMYKVLERHIEDLKTLSDRLVKTKLRIKHTKDKSLKAVAKHEAMLLGKIIRKIKRNIKEQKSLIKSSLR